MEDGPGVGVGGGLRREDTGKASWTQGTDTLLVLGISMKEMGTGTIRGAEKSSQYTEEDGWAETKPDSGRQRVFPVGQARSSAPYLIITFPSPQKEWKRNYCYPHFLDEAAEAQGV